MKKADEIYDSMTVDAQDVVDYILEKLSDVCQEDIKYSAEVRENVIQVALDTMDNYHDNPLTLEERTSICDYVEAEYGICM